MRRLAGSLLLGGVMATLALTSEATAQTSAPSDLGKPFRAADRNRDGQVDREEYQGWMAEVFYFHDTGRKGYLALDDLKVAGVSAQIYAITSRGDGRLSLSEFLNATFLDFDAADGDRSGTLTLEEFLVYVRRTQP
jgi:Ca2+-binding EF-hand superfamily protein